MDVCSTDIPVTISLAPGDRSAACWLQDGHAVVPPELAAGEPGPAAGPAANGSTGAGTSPAGTAPAEATQKAGSAS
jgi:hypothetical protein